MYTYPGQPSPKIHMDFRLCALVFHVQNLTLTFTGLRYYYPVVSYLRGICGRRMVTPLKRRLFLSNVCNLGGITF